MESKKRLNQLSQEPQLMSAVVTASKHAALAGCADLDASSRGGHLQLAYAAMPSGKGLTASELQDTMACPKVGQFPKCHAIKRTPMQSTGPHLMLYKMRVKQD